MSSGDSGANEVYAKALAESNRAFSGKVKELSLVRRLCDALLKADSLESTLRLSVDIIYEEMEPMNCSIMLYDERRCELILRSVRGRSNKSAHYFNYSPDSRVIPVDTTLAGKAVLSRTTFYSNDTKTEPSFLFIPDGVKILSILCTPLLSKSKVLGVINLSSANPDHFTTEAGRILSIVSGYVAMSVENVNLLKDLLAKERLSALGAMASTMVHDMKTPIHVIGGFAQLLLDEGGDRIEREEYYRTIQTQLKRFTSLAEDTLEYVRGHESSLTFTPITLEILASEVSKAFGPLLDKNGISLSCTVVNNATIKVDWDKFWRVIDNIVKNSINAMSDGGKMNITFTGADREAIMEFSDNGPGIPAMIREKIFDPFVTMDRRNGTGLGLAIVKKIVNQHGGSITVTSSPGSGSTFIIGLPADTMGVG